MFLIAEIYHLFDSVLTVSCSRLMTSYRIVSYRIVGSLGTELRVYKVSVNKLETCSSKQWLQQRFDSHFIAPSLDVCRGASKSGDFWWPVTVRPTDMVTSRVKFTFLRVMEKVYLMNCLRIYHVQFSHCAAEIPKNPCSVSYSKFYLTLISVEISTRDQLNSRRRPRPSPTTGAYDSWLRHPATTLWAGGGGEKVKREFWEQVVVSSWECGQRPDRVIKSTGQLDGRAAR